MRDILWSIPKDGSWKSFLWHICQKPLKSVVYSVVFCRVYTMIRMRDVPYLDHERGGESYKKILLVLPL